MKTNVFKVAQCLSTKILMNSSLIPPTTNFIDKYTNL